MTTPRPKSSFLSVVLLFLFLAGPAYADPVTYAALYFRRTTADPFTDPGYNESEYGTNLTSLSHTSPRGSIARFTADAAAGTLKAFAHAVNGNIAAGIGGDNAWALGRVSDSFTLGGPAPGTPVSITAYFTVDGTLSGSGGGPFTIESQENAYIAAQFTAGSSNDLFSQWARTELQMADSWENGGGGFSIPVHRVLSFNLDIVAGTPFSIYYALDARGGWAYGGTGGTSNFGATGAMSFAIPVGTSMTSSGGFIQVPEPSILTLLGSGLAGVAFLRKRSKARGRTR